MKKNLKTVKTGIIFGLVLISMFAVFAPNASAGILKITPIVTLTAPTAQENIIPGSGVLLIPLSTSFTLSGIGRNTVATSSLLMDTPLTIQLKVESTADWVTATIDNPQVLSMLDDKEPKISNLKITVTEKAPAFQFGSVTISTTTTEIKGLLFTIAQDIRSWTVSFVVGYWPVVSYQAPKGTSMQVSPGDTKGADIPIDVINLANGPTHVTIVPETPKGDWSINIASSVDLNSAANQNSEGTKQTVHLIIKPPNGFGFHNERQTFKVQFTPYMLGGPSGRTDLVGQTETVSFTVDSIGFSPGTGFEIPLIVAVLVVIGIVLYLYIYRYRKK